jgi:DNA-binding Xre family transcriptional regulator
MPTNWKLRELLKERGVKSASEISRMLEESGYQLSVQAVCDLLNRKPKMIRLETIEAICNAFYIPLSAFLEVLPMASQKPQKKTRTRQTPSDESAQRARDRGVGPSIRTLDYAGFYPDARKFSSGSTKLEDRCK